VYRRESKIDVERERERDLSKLCARKKRDGEEKHSPGIVVETAKQYIRPDFD
jgi:hypothetical protein